MMKFLKRIGRCLELSVFDEKGHIHAEIVQYKERQAVYNKITKANPGEIQ